MKLLFEAAQVGGIVGIETATFADFESYYTPFYQTVASVTEGEVNTKTFPKKHFLLRHSVSYAITSVEC